ncbi:MAG TPA: hydroxymethylbilane synthase [Thermoleophilaceae bacterium]|nr:hydroxymethylbilane synthase [Thermoleophilaceae bacterium]
MIRLGTRASALALAQAHWVAERLPGEVELVPTTTMGDRRRGAGDKGRFVKELEEGLLSGSIDLAVHSAKDVPSALPDGLAIVGVPERADARDALCGALSLGALDSGAVVGTASVRRRAQLLALRPDIEVRELRGNVDTRLARLAGGDFHAIVLARAGLERLGRAAEGAPLGELVPAPGQGCLALEARAGDRAAAAAAEALTERSALVCLTAERALVAGLDATCNTPVGAHARLSGEALELTAFVGLPDGSEWIRDSLDADARSSAALGALVAERMTAAGAAELLARAEALAGEAA